MKSIATIIMTDEPSFVSWVMTAPPFMAVIYYRGYLAKNGTAYSLTARRAFKFEQEGLVWLFQRRLDNEQYDYIAVRRPIPKKDGDPLALPASYSTREAAE